MAEWIIETDTDRTRKEQEYRLKYGDEGYEDRKATAKAKADELEKAGHWEHAMFLAPQFEGIAMTASEKIWPRLREMTGIFWMKLFQRIAP